MKITLAKKQGSQAFLKRLSGYTKLAAYVGIPASSSRKRSEQLLRMAGSKSTARSAKLKKAAKQDVNNAELLYIFSEGSPLRKQPPRPVLQPSVQVEPYKSRVTKELGEGAKFALKGDRANTLKSVQRAALTGQNAARAYFTNTQNNWAPNAPSTIKRKGSDRPGIDTGAMRAAIQGIVSEET